jgi:hypothetical protein
MTPSSYNENGSADRLLLEPIRFFPFLGRAATRRSRSDTPYLTDAGSRFGRELVLKASIIVVLCVCCVSLVRADDSSASDDPQLKILRQMMPYWDNAESGGIRLLGGPSRSAALVAYRTLAGLPADGSGDARLGEKWQTVLPSLIDKLDRFLRASHLEAGTYTFPNPYYALIKSGALKRDSVPLNSDRDGRVIVIPPTEEVTFTVTEDHLTLLRHMHTRSFEADIEVMDPKRPYGDMSNFLLDMADALGKRITRNSKGDRDLSTQEIDNYERLHGEMLWAVAAFLRYAKP